MVKKLTAFFIYTIMFCFAGKTVLAQPSHVLPPNQPEQDACKALSICGNKFFTPYSYQGQGRVTDMPNTPCGSGEGNSMWVKLQIKTGGTIVFSIVPLDGKDDYDFAVINATNVSCTNLSPADVVRCNFNANQSGTYPGGIVGLNMQSNITSVQTGAAADPFCRYIDALAGETYLVMINNFGHDDNPAPSKGFTVDFTGSTADFRETPAPVFSSISTPLCNGATSLTIQLTDPVLCSSIAPDGSDFAISGGVAITGASGVNCTGVSGYTNTVTIQFAGITADGNYTLSARQGSDANTLLGLCDRALVLPANIQFTVLPAINEADNRFICYRELPYKWNGITVNKGGPAAASYTTKAAGGCDSTVVLNLTVSPAPLTKSFTKTICAGGEYILPWPNTAVVTTAGVYTHTYPATTGCDSLQLTITVDIDSPSKNVTDFICKDSLKVLGIGQGYSNYTWSNGATTPTITISQPGVYTVQATDTYGCIAADTLNIATDALRSTLAKNILLCQGTTVTMDAGAGFKGYVWNDGTTQQTLSTNNPGAYWVTVTDEYGCPASDTANVTAVMLPADFLTATSVTKCFYDSITLKPNRNFNAYLWSTGVTTQAINILTGATYSLKVTDANGCIGTDSIIIIDSACAQYVYVPTAFTPNGDGHNDKFKPGFAGLALQYNLSVYNRLGQKVFESRSPSNGWDGTINGNPQPMGVYVWFCRYQLAQQQPIVQKGTVTLIR